MNPYPSGQGDNICNIWQKGLHLLLRYRMDLTGIVVLITVSWASANETREPFGVGSYGEIMGSYGKMQFYCSLSQKQRELILENGLTSWPSRGNGCWFSEFFQGFSNESLVLVCFAHHV